MSQYVLETQAKMGGGSCGSCGCGMSSMKATYMGCSGGQVSGARGSSRIAEKQELIALNARLQQYIGHMRDMKGQHGYGESASYLEEEFAKLKAMYEEELSRARMQIEEISRSKKHLELDGDKSKGLIAELKCRLESEQQRSCKFSAELDALQRNVSQKDMMIEQGKIEIQNHCMKLEKLNIEYQHILNLYEDLRRRCDDDDSSKHVVEEKFDALQKKMEFQASTYRQETKELEARLRAANVTIQSLEAKLRGTGHGDGDSVSAKLKRARETAEEELRRYQYESEERHNRHLTELKVQIESDDKRILELTQENIRLNDQTTQLLVHIKELEGKNKGFEYQIQNYTKMLEEEKGRASSNIQKMELKLVEIKECLVSKMKELNAAKECQISLKAEIESFRSLIEDEEQRLKISGGFSGMPSFSKCLRCRKDQHATSQSQTFVSKSMGHGATAVSASYGYMDSKYNTTSALPQLGQGQQFLSTNTGNSKDYYDTVRDLKMTDSAKKSKDVQRAKTMCNDGDISSSMTETLKILEVHPDGRYIKIVNSAKVGPEDIGGYFIQQKVGGFPVSVFRFPPKAKLPAKTAVTIWAGSDEYRIDHASSDFVHKEQEKWRTGPECTTVLCRPSGQTIAYQKGSHRISKDAYNDAENRNNNNRDVRPTAPGNKIRSTAHARRPFSSGAEAWAQRMGSNF